MLMIEGCNSCASLAGLVSSFIASFILLVIAPSFGTGTEVILCSVHAAESYETFGSGTDLILLLLSSCCCSLSGDPLKKPKAPSFQTETGMTFGKIVNSSNKVYRSTHGLTESDFDITS